MSLDCLCWCCSSDDVALKDNLCTGGTYKSFEKPPSISYNPPECTSSKRSPEAETMHNREVQFLPDTIESIPTLEFSLVHNSQKRTLAVHLQQAYNLPTKAHSGTFVIAFVMSKKEEVLQSRVVRETVNPEFDEKFEFKGISAGKVHQQVLLLKVFHCDAEQRVSLVGIVIVPLRTADLYGFTMRRKIDDTQDIAEFPQVLMRGELLVSLMYNHRSKLLEGEVLKAVNVHKPHLLEFADPYVRVVLFHKEKRQKHWKSHPKGPQLTSAFNLEESFQFDISRIGSIKDISLEVLLADNDHKGRVGVVFIGPKVQEETGRTHWSQMLASPQQQVSYWHTLLETSDL